MSKLRFITLLALAGALALPAAAAPAKDLARLKAEAAQVTIVRDDWGIAHVHGKTDAQAVFGMIYAQAEDDFNRVEANYLTSLGRTAEAEGQGAIWQDLRQRLFIDPIDLKAKYAASPVWLKALMDGWADGLNYYLATHPGTHPKVITHFEPWMALSFTEGSIGGDIEKVSLPALEAFYGSPQIAAAKMELAEAESLKFKEPAGSNGMAIGPSITKDGHALLLINPHTSFYFRSELQMTSDEGLNVYGAATWGQFFIYQGFNDHAGWMHTSTGADTVDEFAETILRKGGKLFYRYGAEERPVGVSTITVPYRTPEGTMAAKTFTVYRTHHGPIVHAKDDKWIAMALMNKPVEALEQSFGRTKTTDLASFLKVAELAANSSNDTLFADTKGETALLLPQFMPKRDNRFDYTKPVDGSNPATDWRGVTPFTEMPKVISPSNGWVYNSNDSPWHAAGPNSPKKADFPRYMDQAGDNPRTPHAVRVLTGQSDFTLAKLIATDFDSYLPAFARLVPGLVAAYDALPASDPQKARLAEPIAALRAWDDRWSATSVETSLGVGWGEALWAKTAADAKKAGMHVDDYMAERATPAQKLDALAESTDRLTQDFGTWRTPWGQINRFQRVNDDIVPHFDDAAPSIPVPFASAQWGSLASFGAKRYPDTKRYYGSSGNSFVAVIEFGPRIRARAVTAGGESGDPTSKHFADEASRYASGDFREVYFYPDQLTGHTERTYHPGG
ncbi:penicillin acylase family protein [Phenylobacterium sp.]|jgi:acyl-homoserine-lactone acylase|uniref:penicillin acylase family protein n=1 Tax=Phenylobacterium sp. TaxID=1871053 RepID=UPI002E2F5C0A|nr:penicillin acylase family protein [Phenylobacterium sp.]HEX3364781.1 penicillin acylase family protein [Phenylobacterium sp.]